MKREPGIFEIPGKDGLVVLNDRPIDADTPAHLLHYLVSAYRPVPARRRAPIPANLLPNGDN